MAIDYVKFQRGSQAAYDKLLQANRVNDSTLYFIYSEDNREIGKLYLGARLISGGEINTSEISLTELSDVLVNTIKENSFLIQQSDGKWDNITPTQVAELIKNSLNFISEIVTEDDDIVVLNVDGNKITGFHAEVGPVNGAQAGAAADASISTFGETIQIKVPNIAVDKYGHTTTLDEKTLSISIPELPDFIDTNTTYELVYETDAEGKKSICLYDGDGSIISTIDASEFIKDGMLEDVSYNEATNELTFVWNTSSGKASDVIKLTDILDPYIAGNGIKITDNEISIKIIDGEKNLVINENGLSSNFDLNNYITIAEAKIDNGIRFINQEEIDKLNKLMFQGDDLVISGTVNADSVIGLNEWITSNRDKIPGLVSTKLENNVSEALNSLENLFTQIETKFSGLDTRVSSIESDLNNYLLASTFNEVIGTVEDDIETLKAAMTWNPM